MDGDFEADEGPRDLVEAFPVWRIGSEDDRCMTALVARAASDQLGLLVTARSAAEQFRLARTTGQRIRDLLFDLPEAAALPEVLDLAAYADRLALALAGTAPDLDRFAEQLRFYVDYLHRAAA